MNIKPDTSIKLITAPFKNIAESYKLRFSTQAIQATYFNTITSLSLSTSQYTNISNGVISVAQAYNDIKNYNYLYWYSANFSNKIIYCYITHIEEISSNLCYIYFEIDSVQTWSFDSSKEKYFSANPIGQVYNIQPDIVRVKAGNSVKLSAVFSDYKHTSKLATFSGVNTPSGVTINADGTVSIGGSVAVNTTFTVRATDIYDSSITASATFTVI